MGNPGDLKYTKEHEWVRVEGDTATVGITEYAQSALGEIVYVELPEVGVELEQGEGLCVVESTKAASDVYSPIGGTISEVNESLADAPETVNDSPFEEGWIAKLTDINSDDLGSLMSADEYDAYLSEQD